ncbi:MAG TPA: sigma-70 family RNA polymerase sigma factor [Blastocatellia bacterium]|nr:sigma-70 family RNA polymerase sigma factor [Blastocatellia bacterium]
MISSPSNLSDLSPETFAAFLARLASDPAQAGAAYEEQRQMLVKFFECRGVVSADDLADEVFNRVARRLSEGEVIENLPGYCFGIARFVLLEHLRSPEQQRIALDDAPPLIAPEREDEDDDVRLACLQTCLQSLPPDNRALILEYYQDNKRARIDVRQAIADRWGITRNALSNRMVRLRTQLEQCITRCVKKNAAQIRKH